MFRYAIARIGLGLAVALFVSAVAFGLLFLAGDPASRMAGEGASSADIAALRTRYGFDRPVPVQYGHWIARAISGDLGESYYFKVPVMELLRERLPVTLKLGLAAIIFAVTLGVPLGIVASLRPHGWIDRAALFGAVIGQALPSFWFALVLVTVFSMRWPILPASGSGSWLHFVLPTVVLGYLAMPAIMRLTRTGMIATLSADYIRTARAKGMLPWTVVTRHALRNALVPVVSISTVQFGYMLTGSIVVETIFALHGMGFLAWESINRGDVPTVQAIILLFALVYVLLSILGDLTNAWLDPRMRA